MNVVKRGVNWDFSADLLPGAAILRQYELAPHLASGSCFDLDRVPHLEEQMNAGQPHGPKQDGQRFARA